MTGVELGLRLLTILVAGYFHPDPLMEGSQLKAYSRNDHSHLSFTPFEGKRGRIGGFENYLCPMDVKGVETFSRCDIDCRGQHGSVGGSCRKFWWLGDYNCYCGESTGKRNEKSLQCGADTQNFRDVCKIDCICNHAATGGVCDFQRKACICQNVGLNKRNRKCPYNNALDLNTFFTEKLSITEEEIHLKE